jgi:uncharacterized alkaline shock family protein YloU
MSDRLKNMDAREVELPETVYIRDIETRVFQTICLQTLAKIEGIGLLEGNLIDALLGRELDRVKGIYVEQDGKKHSVTIRVEVNIAYGISIPDKAEEVQSKLAKAISHLTGLHVSSVHMIFKNLILPPLEKETAAPSAKEVEMEETF